MSVQMAAILNNSNDKTSSATRKSADMARARNNFLPSIFEEKNDDKIQDFRKALMISEDDDEENGSLAKVRSAVYDVDSADDNNPSTPQRAITATRIKPPIRRFSESHGMEQWRSKRQGSAYVGRSRSNSCIPSGQRSFGIGQRKITSPGVNRARQVDVADVIDLTNPEEVKEIARRFFQDELKMDSLDLRFDEPEDFLSSPRRKAEREFIHGELWQRKMSARGGHNNQTIMMNNNQRSTNDEQVQKNKHSRIHPYSHTASSFLHISYSKPTVLKTLDATSYAEKKTLTASFKPQADYCSRRARGRIPNPIRRDLKKKLTLRNRGQTQGE